MSDSEAKTLQTVEVPIQNWVELRTEIAHWVTVIGMSGSGPGSIWTPDGSFTDRAQEMFNRTTDRVENVLNECGFKREEQL
jgi:hypothetical protein